MRIGLLLRRKSVCKGEHACMPTRGRPIVKRNVTKTSRTCGETASKLKFQSFLFPASTHAHPFLMTLVMHDWLRL